jgi:hypothetical protein
VRERSRCRASCSLAGARIPLPVLRCPSGKSPLDPANEAMHSLWGVTTISDATNVPARSSPLRSHDGRAVGLP